MPTVIPDKKHKGMYRVRWEDGGISVNSKNPEKKGGVYGFYNLSRASEIARYPDLYLHNTGKRTLHAV